MLLSRLKFRTRLMLVLGLSVCGFAALTIVALSGLQTQERSGEQFQRLTEINSRIDNLALTLLEWSEAMSDLTDDTVDDFLLDLARSGNAFQDELAADRARLSGSDGADYLHQLEQGLEAYLKEMTQLLALQQQLGFESSSGQRGRIDTIGTELLDAVSFLAVVRQAFVAVREMERSYLFEPTAANLELFEERFDAFDQRIESLNLRDRYGSLVADYRAAIADYTEMAAGLEVQQQRFRALMADFGADRRAASDYLQQRVAEARLESRASGQQARSMLVGFSVITGLILLALMLSTGRAVHRSLQNIMADLQVIRSGDLTARLTVDTARNDEFDRLGGGVNSMTEGLSDVVGEVSRVSGETHALVGELDRKIENIAASNDTIGQQTVSMASATEEISTTVERIAESTRSLSEQSETTHTTAESGGETIRDLLSGLTGTVTQMTSTSRELDQLGELSRSIDSVVDTINSLAEQTNLLALNAAIEAARAGDAGRGFSVVADEVRSLAERTVKATGQIERDVGSIQRSTQSVIAAMATSLEQLRGLEAQGQSAGEAIQRIEQHAGTSASGALEMAESVREVAATVRELSRDMDYIAQSLESDRDSIKEVQERSGTITRLAMELDQRMSEFQLPDTTLTGQSSDQQASAVSMPS